MLLLCICFKRTVAKIRPDRYITSSSDVKIIATKSIKFYKFPASWSSPDLSSAPYSSSVSPRSKWIFHISRDLITNCSCHSRDRTTSMTPESDSDRSSSADGNFVIVGRLERNGNRGGRRVEHHPKARLELTAIAPFDSQLKDLRRALRAIKTTDACGGSSLRRFADEIGNHRLTTKRRWSASFGSTSKGSRPSSIPLTRRRTLMRGFSRKRNPLVSEGLWINSHGSERISG